MKNKDIGVERETDTTGAVAGSSQGGETRAWENEDVEEDRESKRMRAEEEKEGVEAEDDQSMNSCKSDEMEDVESEVRAALPRTAGPVGARGALAQPGFGTAAPGSGKRLSAGCPDHTGGREASQRVCPVLGGASQDGHGLPL